ncbi:MAG TPA: hypothetical protein VN408_40860 [Actinoplanes sp.]|nr:hypothetical protein [Actinoplanes sp.]
MADPPSPPRQLDPGQPGGTTPAAPATGGDVNAWATVVVVALVLSGTGAMLVTGHEIHEALLLAAGITLLGTTVARRILADGPVLPTIAVVTAVAIFATVLLIRGFAVGEVVMICGGAGLIAGEVTARVLRSCTSRQGV